LPAPLSQLANDAGIAPMKLSACSDVAFLFPI
jgi:hypothetical protein